MEEQGRLNSADGVELAFSHLPGRSPTLVFLPGFKSDMNGSKALFVRDFCAGCGQAMLRLDYSGHGESQGAFADGTLSRWTNDARAVIEARVKGRMILIGSSMGGWIALLLARILASRVAGLVGIAAAPDFTENLIWATMTAAQRAIMLRDGQIAQPSEYGEPLIITQALIEDGRQNLLLTQPLALACPVRLLQGQNDPDVPWQTALDIAAALTSTDVQTVLIKDGDHRLSRPTDLALLARILDALLSENASQA